MNPDRHNVVEAGHQSSAWTAVDLTRYWCNTRSFGTPSWFRAWSCALILAVDEHRSAGPQGCPHCTSPLQ